MLLSEVFKKNKVLIPYYTLGDPDLAYTEDLVRHSFDSGADMIELGIPFSDPIADGPVIQASHQRALLANPTLNMADGFELVVRVRKTHSQPLLFMTAVNLVISFGAELFFKEAKRVGLNGVIIPDLSIEEADAYIKYAKKYQIALIFLLSPLCTPERMRKIVKASSGFVYLIATTGTTGVRESLSMSLSEVTQKIKAIRDIPVAIGFGISTPAQVQTVWTFAEGAIIGSYLVKKMESATVQEMGQALSFLRQ